MNVLHAKSALLPSGWHENVRLTIIEGSFSKIEIDTPPQQNDEKCAVLLPGMPNLHSHAFQRGMAGLTEKRGTTADSFWSWRSLMYRFALTMSPDEMQSIAAQLYMEMLEAGFTRVGEFHYLHHDTSGSVFSNKAEMAERLAEAADLTKIRMTLLPVFYAHGGFGGIAPNEGQRRFVNTLDDYATLLEKSRKAVKNLPLSIVGVAPHSLRAVTPDELKAVVKLADKGPIHIHIAEQIAEVRDCIAWSGLRPVSWLLDNADVDQRWCLIHATHMTRTETRRMAKSGAIAGLCPVTESNLGDGIFPGKSYLEAGGRFGVGSDSNILISIPEELRLLEYSQRLKHRSRNVMTQSAKSTGRTLHENAVLGGVAALQSAEKGLALDGPADCISLDVGDAKHFYDDTLLDGWIFSNSVKIDKVWIAGIKCVEEGRHFAREAISKNFSASMQKLLSRSASI